MRISVTDKDSRGIRIVLFEESSAIAFLLYKQVEVNPELQYGRAAWEVRTTRDLHYRVKVLFQHWDIKYREEVVRDSVTLHHHLPLPASIVPFAVNLLSSLGGPVVIRNEGDKSNRSSLHLFQRKADAPGEGVFWAFTGSDATVTQAEAILDQADPPLAWTRVAPISGTARVLAGQTMMNSFTATELLTLRG